jgi:hypothetical protein
MKHVVAMIAVLIPVSAGSAPDDGLRGLLEAFSDEPSCVLIQRFIHENREELPTSFEQIVALPPMYRAPVLAELPADKALDVWRAHWHTALPAGSRSEEAREAIALFEQYYEMFHADRDMSLKNELLEFERTVLDLVSRDVAWMLFGRIGVPSQMESGEARLDECNCNSGSSWSCLGIGLECIWELPCQWQSRGCGFGGLYWCDATCTFPAPESPPHQVHGGNYVPDQAR